MLTRRIVGRKVVDCYVENGEWRLMLSGHLIVSPYSDELPLSEDAKLLLKGQVEYFVSTQDLESGKNVEKLGISYPGESQKEDKFFHIQ